MTSEANGTDAEAAMQRPTPSSPVVSSVMKEEQEEEKLQEPNVRQELPPLSSIGAISPKAESEQMLELKREPEDAPLAGNADASNIIDAADVKAEEEQHVPEVKREPEDTAVAASMEAGAVKEEGAADVKQEEELQTPEMKQEAAVESPVRSDAVSQSVENEEVQTPEILAEVEQQELQLPEVSTAQQQPNEEPSEMQHESEALPSSASAIAGVAVSREVLAAELQCVLCHDAFVKPVTIMCGHSFCRICLLDSLLSRSIDESECPICRGHLLDAFSPTEPIAFNVNVALWNIAQMLVSSNRSEQLTEEDEEYSLKLDQLDAKWRIRCLQAQDVQAHNQRLIERSLGADLDDSTGFHSDGNEGEEDQRRGLYPQLRVENIEDGRLKVKRNIVLDTDDENEDGHQGMRMCFAVVEFPSIVDTFSEHQECSIAMLKMEEDEDLDTGFPFFMDENGDDDNLVISDYYNDIKLQVFDDASNLVMERIRSARRGIIEFPGLRLDVPEGVYTFRFSDETFGSFLSIKTPLGALRDASDAPLQSDTYISLVDDEAVDELRRDRGRGRRRRRLDSEEEHDEELSDESDDSFIVGDDEHDEVEDHGEDEGVWEFQSDDEEQDEARERRRQARRRQQAREIATFSGDEDEESDENRGRDSDTDDDDGADHVVSRQKRATSSRFVLDSDEDEEHEANSAGQTRDSRGGRRSTGDNDEDVEVLSDESESNVRRASPTRTQRIITDEDDSLGDVHSPTAGCESTGLPNKMKREHREVRHASFSDDEKESEDDSSERFQPPPKRRRTNQVIVDEYSDDDEGVKDDEEEEDMATNVYDSRSYADSPHDSLDEAEFDDGDHETLDGSYGNGPDDFHGDEDDDEDDAQEDEYPAEDDEEDDYEDEY